MTALIHCWNSPAVAHDMSSQMLTCASRFIHPEQSGASSSASGSEPKRRFRRSTDPELARKELALLLDAAVSSGFVKLVDSASDAESSAEDACEPATADKTLVGETRS